MVRGFKFLAVILLIAGILPRIGCSQEAQQTPQVETESKSNSTLESEQKPGAETPSPPAAPASAPHIIPPADKNENQRDSGKREEEGTEFWTPLAGYRVKITDSLLAIFTFLLFVATLFLWLATRRLVRDAQKTAERQLRAYVAVEAGGVPNWEQGYNSHAMIYVRNFGHTPAYKVVVAGNIEVIKDLPNTDITGTAKISLSGDMHIAPGQHQMTAHEKFFKDFDMADVTTGRKWIAVYGYVKYVDAFDVDRETRYFHLYRGSALGKENVRYHHIGNSAT